MTNKLHKDSILPDGQIDFYMRKDSVNLYSALNKCAEDLTEAGHIILEGWRISDLLREAALNLKPKTDTSSMRVCNYCEYVYHVNKGCRCVS